MKPRNKVERSVLEMSERLSGMTEAQLRWAKGLFRPTGRYYPNGSVWCGRCGKMHPVTQSELAVSLECGEEPCPECGALLHLEAVNGRTRKPQYNTARYVSVVTSHAGWIVVRTYDVRCMREKGTPETWDCDEVYQNWINAAGREVIVSRDYNRSPFSFGWKYETPMKVRKHNGHCGGYFVFEDTFDVTGNRFYPISRVTKIAKRNGWCGGLMQLKCNVVNLIRRLHDAPDVEWLVKAGQWSVVEYMMQKGMLICPYRHAVKIAIRNGYKIADAGIWFDYLDLLAWFGKDTHNAHFVCPDDMQGEHDRMSRKKVEVEARCKAMEQRERLMKGETDYQKRMAPFIGVAFGGDAIQLHVLGSVQEFAEEGDAMHHCVFSNEYWSGERHPESLIMSARDEKGRRLETVEVSLKTWKVVQSRGRCNQYTAHHEAIVSMVEEFIPELQRRAQTAISR